MGLGWGGGIFTVSLSWYLPPLPVYCPSLSLSLSFSLSPSLPPSLPPSLFTIPSLSISLSLSFPPSLPPCLLSLSLLPLPPSLSFSLSLSPPPSLPPSLSQWGVFVVCLEWTVFVCTHTLGSAWKQAFGAAPWWVKAVMDNGETVETVQCAIYLNSLSASFLVCNYNYKSKIDAHDIALQARAVHTGQLFCAVLFFFTKK